MAPIPADATLKLDTLYEGFNKEFRDVPEVTAQVLHDWLLQAQVGLSEAARTQQPPYNLHYPRLMRAKSRSRASKSLRPAQASEAPAPLLVDVRTPAEQQVSMLPGPDAVTQREFEERGPEAFRGRRIVCYCTAGYRSGLFADKSRRSHGLDTYNLRGGILAWTQAGYPLTDPRDGAPTRRVHVFSKDWALQGEGYEPVVFQRPLVALGRAALGGLWRSGLRLLWRGGGGGGKPVDSSKESSGPGE
ncbi:hypothetical protein PLESTB_000834900 [Pleodorina starrii]|uniref:Rhodanese domain-containing protein n=1 Tax=Pleodorina starrii TaxID=330485 RepID=A0A9W6F2P8_9CHLO|nr:hypothetical protein PLESTB_000834900 [Pleodorina starrii]